MESAKHRKMMELLFKFFDNLLKDADYLSLCYFIFNIPACIYWLDNPIFVNH
jgi:hypothetical protein